MNVKAHLVQLLRDGGTLTDLMRAAARAIAEDLGVDYCHLYLCKQSGVLALLSCHGTAATDALNAQAEQAARTSLAQKVPMQLQAALGTVFAVPLISRERPIGAFVVTLTGPDAHFDKDFTNRLSGVAHPMLEVFSSAIVVAAIEGGGTPRDSTAPSPPGLTGQQILRGVPASPGIAIGTAAFRQVFPRSMVQHDAPQGDVTRERERLRDAFQKTKNDLLRMQSAVAGELGEDQALIFAAHLLLLHDPMFQDRIEQAVDTGKSAASSVDVVTEDIIQQLKQTNDLYIQERADDVADLRSRVLGHLLQIDERHAQVSHVVVCSRTTPSIIMELKARGASGVASELDGTTSHGVLLARALGVPAVTGLANLLELVHADDLVIIDGDDGQVILRPNPNTLDDYAARQQERDHARA